MDRHRTANFALKAEGLGKSYQIGGTPGSRPTTLAESLLQQIRQPLGWLKDSRETFWALREASFEIAPGEVVGIVGRNGAGKSTLLKLLSRITTPTVGRATMRGRVGSLLEVGTGFHPELTGRENIYMNGSILGMTRREIDRQFDAIVEFAEIERFLDTPVKRYSSGMYVRLAFSVAAHLEPEILIVDEVLAVGDAAFQRKCLGKMRDVARGDGRTVLFVSHNLAAVRSLCNRALFLERGALILDGTPEEVLAGYAASSMTDEPLRASWRPEESPSKDFHFVEATASVVDDVDSDGVSSPVLSCAKPFEILAAFEIVGDRPLTNLKIGFMLQTEDGELVCSSHDPSWAEAIVMPPGRYISRCRFPAYCLNEGLFQVRFYADIPNERRLQITGFDLTLAIEDWEGYGVNADKLPGILRPQLDWQTAPDS